MPRISAATVKEHHAAVEKALVDAAEDILSREGVEGLTAARVAKQAGIARSSIYRYVESVDDLGGLILERYLPTWQETVDAQLVGIDDPREAILAWARAHLQQSLAARHGWLVVVARAARLSPRTSAALKAVHEGAWRFLDENLTAMGVPDVEIRTRIVFGLVSSGFKCLDNGESEEAAINRVVAAVTQVIDAD